MNNKRKGKKMKADEKEYIRNDGKTAYVVCVEPRGVFFGYADVEDRERRTIHSARILVYWSEKSKGVVGTAAVGPIEGRVSPACPRIEFPKENKIEAWFSCSEEAVKVWESEPWS